MSRLALAALPGSVRTARRHVHDLLRAWELPHLIEAAELVVSELSTNAVKATGLSTDSPSYGELSNGLNAICISLHLTSAHAVIEVWDSSDKPPRREDADPDDEGGRGLLLVEAFATRWGFRRPRTGGKVVWAEIQASSR
ncbi:ATP-binding protein [Sphaerisporangium sp. NPDC051017]|uniref:ATP-binding protein n=1 Tax=Sphaerisporangium sp. NPDC051017 TaxID=3154636 RepID=UPI00342F8AD5